MLSHFCVVSPSRISVREPVMRDSTAMVNQAGEHIATIGFNEVCGLWQIVILQRRELEFFSREVAFCGMARRI